jgi:hypothetical protein
MHYYSVGSCCHIARDCGLCVHGPLAFAVVLQTLMSGEVISTA